MESSTTQTASIHITTDPKTYERIFNAFQTDVQHVSKQPLDFNQWAINCLLDWAEAVEIESARNS